MRAGRFKNRAPSRLARCKKSGKEYHSLEQVPTLASLFCRLTCPTPHARPAHGISIPPPASLVPSPPRAHRRSHAPAPRRDPVAVRARAPDPLSRQPPIAMGTPHAPCAHEPGSRRGVAPTCARRAPVPLPCPFPARAPPGEGVPTGCSAGRASRPHVCLASGCGGGGGGEWCGPRPGPRAGVACPRAPAPTSRLHRAALGVGWGGHNGGRHGALSAGLTPVGCALSCLHAQGRLTNDVRAAHDAAGDAAREGR